MYNQKDRFQSYHQQLILISPTLKDNIASCQFNIYNLIVQEKSYLHKPNVDHQVSKQRMLPWHQAYRISVMPRIKLGLAEQLNLLLSESKMPAKFGIIYRKFYFVRQC